MSAAMIIDHLVINASDLERSRAFYAAALAPLGIVEVIAFPGTAGFGVQGKPEFWLREKPVNDPVHIAFSTDRETVDAFHAAALAAGASDNGEPGVREVYHPHYYGAFVLDPDGHNVEAVCHIPG